MIIDTLNSKIVEAMKARDSVRVSTLKLLSAEIHNYQIDHPQMTQEEELIVVKKEAKKRKDAIEAYKKANLPDRVAREEEELKILQEFLPQEMSDLELSKLVDEALEETGAKDLPVQAGIKEMGKVIGLVMKKAKGNADGGKVANLVKSKLQ